MRSLFLISNFDFRKNVIIFVVDNSSSTHAKNRKKYILVLGGGQTQGLDDTTITSGSKYSINLLPQNDILFKSALQQK